jgi:hypothetical protein
LKFRLFIPSFITNNSYTTLDLKIPIMSNSELFNFLTALELKYNLTDLKGEFDYYTNYGSLLQLEKVQEVENVRHSPGICKATTAKGKHCTNKAKEMYDGYCGVHKNKEERKSPNKPRKSPKSPDKSPKSPAKSPCGGKTKKGSPCKNSGKYEGFCIHHCDDNEEGKEQVVVDIVLDEEVVVDKEQVVVDKVLDEVDIVLDEEVVVDKEQVVLLDEDENEDEEPLVADEDEKPLVADKDEDQL